MASEPCKGSINIMAARERMRLAKVAGDSAAVKAAKVELLTAQDAHRRFTGCTEAH